MPSTFEINSGEMSNFLKKESTKLILKAQRKTLNTAKTKSPVDTGFMRNAHMAGPVTFSGDTARADITVDADYAMAVHEGSRPHIIRPRRAKMLAWRGDGGMIFASSVRHPGSKARPWLYNALKSGAGGLGFEVTKGD